MAINTTVKDPKQIGNCEEWTDLINRLKEYEIERKCKAGVLHIQNPIFGSIYSISSEKQAKSWLTKSTSHPEFGLEFYTHDYFTTLLESDLNRERIKPELVWYRGK